MLKKIINAFLKYRLYLFFFTLIVLFTLLAGFNGLYGQDSYEYLRFTNALIEFAKHGTNPGTNYWPVLYPILGILFSIVFKPLFALQLISILSFVLSGIYLEKILKILYKEYIQLPRFFILVFFLLSPYLLRASITVMSDSLCLLFITASYYYFLLYTKEKKNQFFIVFMILSVAAVATRYAALLVVIIPVLYMLYSFFKKFHLKSFLLASIAVILIVLPYIIIHKSSSIGLMNTWLSNWSFKNFFHSSFDVADGHQVYTFPNLVFSFFNVFHPAYCFTGVIFLIAGFTFFVKRIISPTFLVILIGWPVYAFFLAGMPFQDLRHLILSFPLVIIFLFPGFVKMYDFLKKMYPHTIIPVVALCSLIQIGLFIRVFIPFYHYNKIEKQISEEVIKYDAKTLYTFSIDAAVRHYGFKGEILNLREVKLDTMPVIKDSVLVLFNEKLFGQEWKNENPMLNWSYLETNYKLKNIENFPDDWKLYVIKK